MISSKPLAFSSSIKNKPVGSILKLQPMLRSLFVGVYLFFLFVNLDISNSKADALNEGFVKLADGKFAEAVELWTPLARSGDKVAQASLGLLYQTGQGVPQDFSQANHLLAASARQGYVFAFTALGNSFHEGLGVKKDLKIAMAWFLLAMDYDPNAAAMANMIGGELNNQALASVRTKALRCRDSKYQDCDYQVLNNNLSN